MIISVQRENENTFEKKNKPFKGIRSAITQICLIKFSIYKCISSKNRLFVKESWENFSKFGGYRISIVSRQSLDDGSFYFYAQRNLDFILHRHPQLAPGYKVENSGVQKLYLHIENFVFAKSLKNCILKHHTQLGMVRCSVWERRIMLENEELMHWLSSKHSESFIILQEETIRLRSIRDQILVNRDMLDCGLGLRSW